MSVFIGPVFSLCNLLRLVAFCVVVTTLFLEQVPPVSSTTVACAPTGDSANGTVNDGIWQCLAPGDVITLTAPYTVVQADIDNLQ